MRGRYRDSDAVTSDLRTLREMWGQYREYKNFRDKWGRYWESVDVTDSWGHYGECEDVVLYVRTLQGNCGCYGEWEDFQWIWRRYWNYKNVTGIVRTLGNVRTVRIWQEVEWDALRGAIPSDGIYARVGITMAQPHAHTLTSISRLNAFIQMKGKFHHKRIHRP